MNESTKKIAEIKRIIEQNFTFLLKQAFVDKLSTDPEDNSDYKLRLYGPHRASAKFLRMQEWKIFELFHTGYFGIGKYGSYRKLAKESWGKEKFVDSLAVFIYAVAYNHELESPEKLQHLILTKGAIWWQKRVLWTVWQGKQKELVFGLKLKAVLPQGYSLRKPTEAEDQEYMLDYIVEKNGKVELGISVKGESYRYSKDHNYNDWVAAKEKFENAGHERFFEKFQKDAVTAISSYKDLELTAEEVSDVIYYLENGKSRHDLKTYSSPADSPWMTMSGDFEELEF